LTVLTPLNMSVFAQLRCGRRLADRLVRSPIDVTNIKPESVRYPDLGCGRAGRALL